MDFSFLRAEPFELPDPQALAIRGMTLANLSQTNQEGQMKLDALRQAQDVKQAAAKVFGDAQTMGWDAAIKKAAQEGNTLGAIAAQQLRREDENQRATLDNTRAQANERNAGAAEKAFQIKQKGLGDIANAADGMARSGKVDMNYLQGMAKFYGIPLPPMQEGMDPTAYAANLASSAISAKDRMANDTTMRGQDMTAATAARGQDVTMRGQDISRDTAIRGQNITRDTTIRGQDLTDARTREATAATREATRGQRLDTETQSLAKFVDSNALPNLITSANALDATLQKYSKANDIPGVGIADANMPPILRSTEGNKVRAQIQAVANDLLKLYSGGAVTANEAERRATEMMASGQFNEDDLRNAWPLVKGRINAAVQNVRGGYSPEAIKTYEGRGGIKIAPVGLAPPQLGEVRDGYRYKGGDPGSQASWEKV